MISPDPLTVMDCQVLHELGGRLRRQRKAQGLGTVELAKRAGISRMTVSAVEAGDPDSSMGSYLRVMAVLGLSGELAFVALDRHAHIDTGVDAGRPQLAHSAAKAVASVEDARHQIQDLLSLALHRQAVYAVQQKPTLLDAAIKILRRWVGSNPGSRSMPLWREWEQILEERSWRKILNQSQHAQQLRQASPLVTVLPEDIRLNVLAQVRELKKGMNTSKRS